MSQLPDEPFEYCDSMLGVSSTFDVVFRGIISVFVLVVSTSTVAALLSASHIYSIDQLVRSSFASNLAHIGTALSLRPTTLM